MRTISLLFVLILLLPINKVCCQPIYGKSKFSLRANIIGRDTGLVVLAYFDIQNKAVTDTVALKGGKFVFSGTVNGVCEALLWTDIHNIDFDDSSVVHFLLEPTAMGISYNVKGGTNPIITGSRSQEEKERWDKKKLPLLSAISQIYQQIFYLLRIARNHPDSAQQKQIDQLYIQRDSINKKIRQADIGYIKDHTHSYVSAYLLSNNVRRMDVALTQKYFSNFPREIKTSNLGHQILLYVYPLTNDTIFRQANPLFDRDFSNKLSKIKSVYDLKLRDTANNTVNLGVYRGKYLVIDFWASWCGPCIDNIPYLLKLMKTYKPGLIEFVSISLDINKEDWTKAIIKNHFEGTHLSDLRGFRSLATVFCKVISVPRYIIVDPQGQIINYDAPQPDEPELKTLLDGFLGLTEKEN